MIVDDHRAPTRFVRWGPEDLGYASRAAADCKEALACVTAMRFDFAPADDWLPDGNGHALYRQLMHRQWQLKVLLLSAVRRTADAEIGGPGLDATFIQ